MAFMNSGYGACDHADTTVHEDGHVPGPQTMPQPRSAAPSTSDAHCLWHITLSPLLGAGIADGRQEPRRRGQDPTARRCGGPGRHLVTALEAGTLNPRLWVR